MSEVTLGVTVHEAEEGGYWAEAPSLPGCASQGDALPELFFNICEAAKGWLSANSPLDFSPRIE